MTDLKLSPLIEGAYTVGTIDRRNGFPYWMADKRLYGGGGIALTLGKRKAAFIWLLMLPYSQKTIIRHLKDIPETWLLGLRILLQLKRATSFIP